MSAAEERPTPKGTSGSGQDANLHPVTGEVRHGGVTARAMVIGAIGAGLVGIIGPYSVHVLRGSAMEYDFSSPLALFLFFFVAAGPNFLILRLRRQLALTPGELVTVYGMMVMASPIVTMGIMSQILPIISGPSYFANPQNKFVEEVLPFLKPWLLPIGAAQPQALMMKYFYEGLPPGMSIPWGVWLPPMLTWAPMLMALFLAMISMMILLRKQWVENERLAYPLTLLPLELVGARSAGVPVILKQITFWIGFAISAGLAILVGVHAYYPSVPAPNLAMYADVIKDTWRMWFRVSFPMIGFFYLVNLDVTFSLWAFNLVFQSVDAALKVLGLAKTGADPFGCATHNFKFLGTGAFVALLISTVWVARHHLRLVWERVIGRGDPRIDKEEVLSYPAAFWVLVASTVVMAVWLNLTGMPAIAIPIFLLFAFIFFFGLTRIVVESGMAEAVAPTIAPTITPTILGTAALGRQGMMSLALQFVYSSDIRTFVMVSAANSLRMSTVIQSGHRRLFWAYLIGIAVAFAASFWLTVSYGYKIGATNMLPWFFQSVPTLGYKWAQAKLTAAPGPVTGGWGILGGGALVYLLLAVARFRFMNWPLHPLGFALGPVWIMSAIWFSAFLSWLFKGVILRYGGYRTYLFLRPFFLGLMLGQYSINVLWLGVDTLTGRTGISLFWI
ncbi:MAG: hypothetical protein GX100_04645 [candidate division WS1 bacterium]|nr:hypothetical protein [candidate division WS1 bacterium]